MSSAQADRPANTLRIFLQVLDPERKALLVRTDGPAILPSVDMEPGFYPEVSALVDAVGRKCGVDVSILRCLDKGDVNEGRARFYSAIGDSGFADSRPGFAWVPATEVDLDRGVSSSQTDMLELERDRMLGAPPSDPQAPWQWSGAWHGEARSWIESHLPVAFDDEDWRCSQVRTWSISKVLRIQAAAHRIYFKAVPGHFGSEVDVTVEASERFPDVSPCVIAADPGRGWMLMEDLGDLTLGHVHDEELWRKTMRALARIELEYANRMVFLDGLGLQRRTIERTVSTLDRWISEPDRLNLCAARTRTIDTLRTLEPSLERIREMGGSLDQIGLPATLDHGDLDAGNIFVRDGGPVLMDWSDASISHPFFTAAMMPLVVRNRSVSDAFLRCWSDFASEKNLRAGFEIARVLAPIERSIHYYERILPYLFRPSAELCDLERYVPDLLGLAARELDRLAVTH